MAPFCPACSHIYLLYNIYWINYRVYFFFVCVLFLRRFLCENLITQFWYQAMDRNIYFASENSFSMYKMTGHSEKKGKFNLNKRPINKCFSFQHWKGIGKRHWRKWNGANVKSFNSCLDCVKVQITLNMCLNLKNVRDGIDLSSFIGITGQRFTTQ